MKGDRYFMKETNALHMDAMNMLLTTSRTFLIPISRLVPGLQDAVASAYLCMRAIDEIEDHPELPADDKIKLLNAISVILKSPFSSADLSSLFQPYQSILPSVTLCLSDWVNLCPASIVPRVLAGTADMAEQMAEWVEKGWEIKTEEDLDGYTYSVAGAVGELLSDLWMWHDDIKTDYAKAVAFGRGLQAVNILRNRSEDLARGVDYFPENWGMEEMFTYTRRNLELADAYTEDLEPGPILEFCRIPLELAKGTLNALAAGESKLDRAKVTEIVNRVTGQVT
jgi:farnesyl-diphosphate farnesyltransferase